MEKLVKKVYTVYMLADEEPDEQNAFRTYFNNCDAALFGGGVVQETLLLTDAPEEVQEFFSWT
jgi:hypothetical protein